MRYTVLFLSLISALFNGCGWAYIIDGQSTVRYIQPSTVDGYRWHVCLRKTDGGPQATVCVETNTPYMVGDTVYMSNHLTVDVQDASAGNLGR